MKSSTASSTEELNWYNALRTSWRVVLKNPARRFVLRIKSMIHFGGLKCQKCLKKGNVPGWVIWPYVHYPSTSMAQTAKPDWSILEGTEMGILKQWVTNQKSGRNAIQIRGVDSLLTITVSYSENREKDKEKCNLSKEANNIRILQLPDRVHSME